MRISARLMLHHGFAGAGNSLKSDLVLLMSSVPEYSLGRIPKLRWTPPVQPEEHSWSFP